MNANLCHAPAQHPLKVGILGGGIAGATVALRLADMGIQTLLISSFPPGRRSPKIASENSRCEAP